MVQDYSSDELLSVGRSLLTENNYEQALSVFEQYASQVGEDKACREFGFAYLGLERYQEAKRFLNRAVTQYPDSAQVHLNLGISQFQCGEPGPATESIKKAVVLNPDYDAAIYNLGNVLLSTGRARESLAWLQKFVARNQGHYKACLRLADAYKLLNSYALALEFYQSATTLDPSGYEALERMAALKFTAGEIEEARILYEAVLERAPDQTTAVSRVAHILCLQGYWDRGLSRLLSASKIETGISAIKSMSLWLLTASPSCSEEYIFAQHVMFGEGLPVVDDLSDVKKEPPKDRRLRVGYFGASFNHHVCMDFFLPLLANHTRSRVEVFCYSSNPKKDDVTESVAELAEHWRDISSDSDQAAISRIRDDHLDVLVELDGHTDGNRIGIITQKLAPVTMSWLGYANTTGLESVDYRIVDDVTDPIGCSDSLATETLVRLPKCFLAYLPLDDHDSISRSPMLENGYCTFGNFNNPIKLNDDVIDLWASILRLSEGSVLAFKNRVFTCDLMKQTVRKRFANRGIQGHRIEFFPYKDAQVEHLLDYGKIDVALDPFPYNGTTTTCEALWMGVPVVTVPGIRHASRVGASLLGTIGASELIAPTPDEYIRIATDLAGDAARVAKYRTTLRHQMQQSPLCDYQDFSRRMEDVYARYTGWTVSAETTSDSSR